MFVGVLRLRLEMPENGSLKEKRQALKRILARIQSEFHVAAAEVGDQDRWQWSEIGVACVANDAAHVDEVMAKVSSFVERGWPEYPIYDVETETASIL